MSRFLLEAAAKGDADKVRDYLDKGADIRWQHKSTGRTALSEAAINGHLEVARLLLERGADLNWRDSAVGFTPLGWASDCNHPALVELFLKAGADPNLATHEFFLTPLMVASKNGHLPVVRLLLKAGANVQAATCDGRTALNFAQLHKRGEVIKALAAVGATIGSPLPKPARIPWPAVDATGATRDYSSPEKVLRSFIFAMNRYEKKAAALGKKRPPGATVNQEILAAMQAVFAAYCTPLERPYGRHGSYRTPPEYDPEGEFLIEVKLVNPRRAELITRDKKEENEFLYVILKKKGRWLLDSKKLRLIGANWMKWFL